MEHFLKPTDLNDRVLDPALGALNILNEIRGQYPKAISFAAGLPYEGLFRVREALPRIEEYSARQTSLFSNGKSKDNALNALAQYGATNGIIRSELAAMLAVDEGIQVSPQSIIVTVGSQEAMVVCLLGLCRPSSDVIFIPEPGYFGITSIARLLGIEMCPVHSGEQGLDLEDLHRKLIMVRAQGKRPRLLYDIPDFSNPTGTSMPIAARRKILELAEKHDFLILEDSVYRIFSYDEKTPPSLKALDTHGRVILLNSFAKSIFPGVRLGFMVADQEVQGQDGTRVPLTEHLSKIKSSLTINTPSINQALVAGLLSAEGGSLQRYNEPQISLYKQNRDCLLECLKCAFPSTDAWTKGISWNRPKGGFFIVITLPFPVDDEILRVSASQYGLIWMPMRYFYLKPGGHFQVRLSFSCVTEGEIIEGVRRLGKLVKDLASSANRSLRGDSDRESLSLSCY